MKRRKVKRAYGQIVMVVDTTVGTYIYHHIGRNTKASRYLVNNFNALYGEKQQ